MQKKTFNKLDLDVYEEVLDNGLRIYIAPISRVSAHVAMTSLYGSAIMEFKPLGQDEYFKIPAGTAHFLEHKMFAKEDGQDIMDIFQKNGARSNAYTNNHITSYYFNAPNHFYENLENLLNCVTIPYYTAENIEKEKGIIDQEVKAGFDDPTGLCYYTALLNTFKEYPYRYPVAGYSKTIKNINADILYNCYNTFYHPANMLLTIAGDVNPEEVISFVKNYYAKKDYPPLKTIEIKHYDEPQEVLKKDETIHKDITNNIIEMAYKISIKDNPLSLLKILSYIGIYLDIKFGAISKFNKEAMENKNILYQVGYMMDNVGDYIFIDFDTSVVKVDNIFDLINENLNNRDFSEQEFNLIVKNIIKSLVLMSDNVYNISNTLIMHICRYGSIQYDIYNFYQSLNYEECRKLINSLDFSHYTRTIIAPKS